MEQRAAHRIRGQLIHPRTGRDCRAMGGCSAFTIAEMTEMQGAPLTLVRGDLRVATDAIRLSRRRLRIIESNLFRAFGYDVAAIQLAAAGLLNPMLAGAAMAGSPVFVVTNSPRLRSSKALAENR